MDVTKPLSLSCTPKQTLASSSLHHFCGINVKIRVYIVALFLLNCEPYASATLAPPLSLLPTAPRPYRERIYRQYYPFLFWVRIFRKVLFWLFEFCLTLFSSVQKLVLSPVRTATTVVAPVFEHWKRRFTSHLAISEDDTSQLCSQPHYLNMVDLYGQAVIHQYCTSAATIHHYLHQLADQRQLVWFNIPTIRQSMYQTPAFCPQYVSNPMHVLVHPDGNFFPWHFRLLPLFGIAHSLQGQQLRFPSDTRHTHDPYYWTVTRNSVTISYYSKFNYCQICSLY